jgi:hypothetical protein
MARRYLLTIDGGGIRGIIPAVALAKLEATTGRPARETFSFVGGTSTGAIIAAAIAAGIPATRIVALYIDRAREVFAGVTLLNTLQRIITGSIYSTRRLRNVIAEELGPEARDWSLNDSPIDVLITAKGVPGGKAWYFVKDNLNNSGCTGTLGLADCVTGSAAAPTYFKPWTIEEPPGKPPHCDRVGAVVDGGVGVAGNPVYQACVEAFYYTDETNGYEPGETTTVSMGTGRSIVPKRRPTWIWSWLQWVLGELLESPGEQQTEIAWRHFVEDQPEDQKMTFYRIDTKLEEDIALDDVGAVERVREYGERLAALIDWEKILDGTDESFRVRDNRKRFPQYAKETI